jgi:hypothetical protein
MDRFSLVRWRAANALKKITGKDFGDDPKNGRSGGVKIREDLLKKNDEAT